MKRRLKRSAKRIIEAALSPLPDTLTLPLLRCVPRLANCMPPGRIYHFGRYLGDLNVRIDTSFSIERQMLSGTYDPDSCQVIRRFVREGSICFDIGANVGALALAMAQRAGAQGRVFAFEPGPSTFQKLQENISLNEGLSKVVLPVNLGVADTPGHLFWNEDPDNPGNAWLLRPTGTKVSVITVDDFCVQEQLQRLDFVKIDVEGMEYEVLRGGVESWRRFRPVIYFETRRGYEKERGLPLFQRIEDLLTGLGYELFRFEGERQLAVTAKTFANDTLAIPAQS